MVLVAFFMWLGFAGAVGAFASSRGRDFVAWGGIALLISPLVAFVLVMVLPEGAGVAIVAQAPLLLSASASDLLDRVETLFDRGAVTPFDHQRIKILAAREVPAPAPAPARAAPAQFTRPCPSCGKLIHPQATTCMHCWTKLGSQAA